jgi:hypothetical protein
MPQYYRCWYHIITDSSIISISTTIIKSTGLLLTDANINSISTHCTGLQTFNLSSCDQITDASIKNNWSEIQNIGTVQFIINEHVCTETQTSAFNLINIVLVSMLRNTRCHSHWSGSSFPQRTFLRVITVIAGRTFLRHSVLERGERYRRACQSRSHATSSCHAFWRTRAR